MLEPSHCKRITILEKHTTHVGPEVDVWKQKVMIEVLARCNTFQHQKMRVSERYSTLAVEIVVANEGVVNPATDPWLLGAKQERRGAERTILQVSSRRSGPLRQS